MRVLITSGGCKVPIDDVRHIGNFSSGRYGIEIAKGFLSRSTCHDKIIVFREKGSAWIDELYSEVFNPDNRLTSIEYKDYWEYLNVKELIKKFQPDIIVSAAAISDFICDKINGKIASKGGGDLVIRLKKGEKVIQSFRELAPDALIVGFKLLVGADDDQKLDAINSIFDSGVDRVVYNDLEDLRSGDTYRQLFRRDDSGTIWHDGDYGDGFHLATKIYEIRKEKLLNENTY